MAGKNEISALSKPPNVAMDWLGNNHCDSIKTAVPSAAELWLTLAGAFFSLFNPLIVYGLNYVYRRCVQKYPQLGGNISRRDSNGFFRKCYHKLVPDREAIILFGTFLVTTGILTISMVEIVAAEMKGELQNGFDAIDYHCDDPSLEAPLEVNQIIRAMAGPVSKTARLAAYFPMLFFLAGSAFLTLASTAAVRYCQKKEMGSESTPLLVPNANNINNVNGYGM